jgi:hypothetical protein
MHIGVGTAWVVLRMVMTWAGSATLAFWVSDYVVKAHMSNLDETNAALINSIDLLNQSILVNTASLDGLRNKLDEVSNSSVKQEGQLVVIQDQMAKIQTAVEAAGIDIKAKFSLEGLFDSKSMDWAAIKSKYNLSEAAPIFIQFGPRIDENNP